MMQLLVACGFAAVGAMLFVSLRSRLDGLHRLIARTSHLERALLVVLAAAFVAYGGSKPVSVTVPDAANTTVEVKTNGVTVATEPDTFTFQSGSSLSVVYTADEHYQITANASTNIDFLFDAVEVTAPTVKPIVVTSVTLNVAATNLNIGESFQLVETVEPADALDKTIAWTSSDNAVATVTDKGVVTAVGTGTATVTATNAASGVFASCMVSVGIPMYEMTVAKVDHATVAAVSNDTVAVEFTSGDDGVKFTVPSNSTVKVYFAPEEGYSLDTSMVETTVTSAGSIDVSGIVPVLITYDIAIDSEIANGKVETSVTNDVVPGAEVTLTVAADEGYALQNLSVMSGGIPVTLTDDGKFTMPKGDVNITATFTQLVFTVTFTTNGVVYAVSNNVPWGTSINDVLPSDPEVDGYDFEGWDPSDVSEICADVTFAAKLAIKKFTVTFMANGSEHAVSNDVPWGTAFANVKPADNPTSSVEGQTFLKWEPDDVLVIVSNTIYTAAFTSEPVYKLNLIPGMNTTLTAFPSQDSYLAGTVVKLTATPMKNYKLSSLPDGWHRADDGTATNTYTIIAGENAVTGPAAVLDTVTFTVKAIPGAKVDKVYTNAGENVWVELTGDYTVIRGAKVKVTFEPDGAYQLTASEFVTDALMDDSTEIDAAETIKPVALYTVTFKVEGQADYVTNSIPSNTEFAVIKPADPTAPTGQSFKCWEPVEEFVVSNTTYTAAFTNNFYDITFKNADGTWNEVVSTEYNVMPVEPAAPDVTGHSFKEWTPAVVAAVEDATYTAVYMANVYAVTFENGNNSTIAPTGVQYYDYGTALEITATAAEGYEFAEASYEGWEKQSNSKLTTNVTVTAAATFTAPDATVAIATVDVTLPEKLPDGVEKLVVSQSEDGEQWVEVTDGKVIVGYQWKVEGVAKEGYIVSNPIISGTAASGQTIEVTEEEVQGKVTANTFTVEVPAAANATVAVSTNDVAAGADGTYTLGSGTKVAVVYTAEAGYKITANAETNIASLVENVTVAAPTVEEIFVEQVSLDCTAKTLAVGGSFTLVATVTPEDALDKTIDWTTSDSRIATVDDGLVTAVCGGTATITAKNAASGESAICTVTVGLVPSGTVTKPKADDSGMVKGKSGSWSAKPNEACVFTGWVWEGEPDKLPAEFTSLSENELRNAKIKVAIVAGMNVRTQDVAATWAWIDEDKIKSVELTPSNLVVECKSYVTASAGGLPSGLKFDKKTLKITGAAKKSETKVVKVTVKNASGYTWKQNFTVKAEGGVLTEIKPDIASKVETGVPVMLVGGDSALGAVKGSKVIVAGKKASIKATPAKGSIFLGWYEDAVFDKPADWLGKGYLTASQPVPVGSEDITLYARIVKLETWAQGTFDGVYFETGDEGDESLGTVTFTVSNKGKVSGKTLETGSSSAFKANMIEDAYYDADGAITYVVNPIAKVDGVEQKLKVEISFDEDANLGSAVIKYGEDADSPYAAAVQNGWKLKPVWLPGFAKGLAKTLDNGLTFSFGAKGSVKISGTYAGVKVSAKAQLLPVEWDAAEKTLKARVCVYLPKSSPLICETYDFVLTAGADGNFSTVEESED